MPLSQFKNLLDAHAQPILSGGAFDAVDALSASMFDLRLGVEESPVAEAVRWRFRHLARRIDSLQRPNRTVRCLSLACGHLCEAELSDAVRHRKAMIFAVDQDRRSLRLVSKYCAHVEVDPICASVLDVLNGKTRFGQLDLAYASELFDELSTPVATALAAKLFAMLDSGGIVIVPNFLDRDPARRHRENFKDWNPVLRSREEIIALASAVPRDEIGWQRYYEDPFGVIGYLEISR